MGGRHTYVENLDPPKLYQAQRIDNAAIWSPCLFQPSPTSTDKKEELDKSRQANSKRQNRKITAKYELHGTRKSHLFEG